MRNIPKPVDTSGETLSQDIVELTELLARNTHDIRARLRISEGWIYGRGGMMGICR